MSRSDAALGAEPDTWLNQRERGAIFGIRLVFFLATVFGRAPAGLFLRVVALWYAAFDKTARAASRTWLSRVHNRPATFRDVYRHIYRFARVALDRVFLLRGATSLFRVKRTGNQHLQGLAEEKRGAVLMGAHLGSFEAMRAGAKTEQFPINIVGHFENARMINSLLSAIDPDISARVLHVGDDPVSFALGVRERLAAGEMVAILADRVGLNNKSVEVEFFGKPARFPTGPFLLAATLRCPVYLVFGLYFEPDRYELFCEPFADPLTLPRATRKAALKAEVQRFAQRLEHYARMAPENWFNFYNFWEEGPDGST